MTSIDPRPAPDSTNEDARSIDALDSGDDALEVRVLWGNQVLHVAHLSPPRPFVIGDCDDADFTLPTRALGTDRMELPMDDGAILAGGLAFQIRNVQRARRVAAATPSTRELLRDNAWLVASLGAHFVLLGLFALLPPSASAVSIQDLRSDPRYVSIELKPDATQDDDEQLTPLIDQTEGGAAEEGDSGASGVKEQPKRNTRAGVRKRDDDAELALARKQMIEEATSGGLIGALRAAAERYDGPTSVFGADLANGRDPMDAWGKLLAGAQIASSQGIGGLGMVGTGRHGGGRSALGTIGTGTLGTIGGVGDCEGVGKCKSGFGVGLPGRTTPHKGRVPRIRTPEADVAGALSKESIRRTIRRQLPKVRFCYEQSLKERPDLRGRVSIKFVIGATGSVRAAFPASSTLQHPRTERCITEVVKRLDFEQPKNGGVVTVTYPFVLSRI